MYYIYICINIYIYIYVYVGRTCWIAPMFVLIGTQLEALLGGMWNVHSFDETCTTWTKRAQLVWNVHDFYETCRASMKRAQLL